MVDQGREVLLAVLDPLVVGEAPSLPARVTVPLPG